jgi:hypothetical protein
MSKGLVKVLEGKNAGRLKEQQGDLLHWNGMSWRVEK